MEVKALNKKEANRKIFSLIIPITIENILQMTAGFITSGMVGRLEESSINGLFLSMRITQLVWALLKGITTGATVFVAQAYGAGNFKKMRKVIHQTLISSIVVAAILAAVIYFKAEFFLSVFKPDPATMTSAVAYMKIVVFGMPFLAILLIVGGVLQGMGNTITPMKVTFIMNVVNIVFGYMLIFGHFGFSPLAVKGAAMATVISQMAAAFIGLYILFSKKGILRSHLNQEFFKLDFKQIGDIYKVAMPASLETMSWQIAAIILSKIIFKLGKDAYAAHSLGMQAESISYMPALGFSIAATAFIGQCLGAGDEKNAKLYLRQTIKGSILITSFSVVLLIVFPAQIMRLLTDKKEIIELGVIYLRLMGLVQLPQNIAGVINGAFRGAGYTNIPMITAMSGLWGVRVIFTVICYHFFNAGIVTIWIVMCFDLVFRFLLSSGLFKFIDIYKRKSLV